MRVPTTSIAMSCANPCGVKRSPTSNRRPLVGSSTPSQALVFRA